MCDCRRKEMVETGGCERLVEEQTCLTFFCSSSASCRASPLLMTYRCRKMSRFSAASHPTDFSLMVGEGSSPSSSLSRDRRLPELPYFSGGKFVFRLEEERRWEAGEKGGGKVPFRLPASDIYLFAKKVLRATVLGELSDRDKGKNHGWFLMLNCAGTVK